MCFNDHSKLFCLFVFGEFSSVINSLPMLGLKIKPTKNHIGLLQQKTDIVIIFIKYN